MSSTAGNTRLKGRRARLWSVLLTTVVSTAMIAALIPTAASAAVTAPLAPTGLTVTAVSGSLTANWSPGADGGSAIIDYTATASPGGATCTVAGPFASTCNLAGTDGVAYTVTVAARNLIGIGTSTAPSAAVTVGNPPTFTTTPTAAGTGVPGEVAVTWVVPTNTFGSSVSGYVVQAYNNSTSLAISGATCSTTGALTCTVTGLTSGGTFKFDVTVTTPSGSTTSPLSLQILPNALPTAPTSVGNAPVKGNGSLKFTWAAPTSTGGSPITSYTVQSLPGGQSVTVASSATPNATLTGLTNGVSYQVQVSATNANGTGPAAPFLTTTANRTPSTKPDAPTNVTAAPKLTTATPGVPITGTMIVAWDIPAYDGASPVTAYTVTATGGSGTPTPCVTTTNDATASSCLFDPAVTAVDLVDGTPYVFTVHATNANGNSVESGSVTATPASSLPAAPTTPGTPRGALVGGGVASLAYAGPTHTSGEVLLRWNSPISPGASPITAYTVTNSTTGAPACSTTGAVTCVVSGLTDGTAYVFTVVATSAAGSSATPLSSIAGTPDGLPTAPTGLALVATNNSVTATWNLVSSAPANGGLAVANPAGYTVTSTSGVVPTSVSGGGTVIAATGTGAVTVTVSAKNTNGEGPVATATVSPSLTPSAPLAFAGVATVAGTDFPIALTWAAPQVTGAGLTGYTVTATAGTLAPGCTTGLSGTSTGCTVTGLTAGTTVTFTVRAATAAGGNGPVATTTVTAGLLPTVVTSGTVAAGLGNGSAVVTWVPGTSTGTNFKAVATPGGASCQNSGTSCTITGLTVGTAYTFKVYAMNSIGMEQAGVATTGGLTAIGKPGDPTTVALTRTATGELTLGWTVSTALNGSTVTGHTVTVNPGGFSFAAGAGATSQVASGLTNGTEYTFVITTDSNVGSSAGVTVKATPATTPGGTTGVTATAGDASATVSWTAASVTGGSAITGYVITATPAAPGVTTVTATTSGTGTTGTVSGLRNGLAYTFTVKAKNAVGTSTVASNTSTAVTPGAVPDAPSPATATAAAGQITVAWVPSASSGGLTLSGYTVSTSPGTATCSASGTSVSWSCTVTGLSGLTAYSLSVVANNAAGSSTAATVTATTPRNAPVADSTVNHSFGDVSGLSAGAQSAIAALQNLGIANGLNATTYGAGSFVLREHMALFVARTLTVLGLTPNNTVNHSFADVSGLDTETQNAIAWLNNLGIVNGVNATTYGTGSFVLREHMALFISRSMAALGLPTDTTVNHTFADVSGLNTETQNAVASINNAGISVGLNATTYGTGSDVVRENMALFIVRLLNLGLGVL